MEDPSRSEFTMDDLLEAFRKVILPEGGFCTAWVVVTEWVDLHGDYWTYVDKDQTNPTWRHEGLLNHIVSEGLEDDDYEDEEG